MQKRFLIIRLSSIGDILLTTPFVRALRKKYPDSRIDFLIKSDYAELIANNKNINNKFKFEANNGFSEILNWRLQIKSNNYDAIFDLHRNIRTLMMTSFNGGTNSGKYNKRYFKRFMLVNFGINLYGKITPVSERYFEVGSAYNLVNDGLGLDLFVNNDNHLHQSVNPSSQIKIVIAPGAGYATKRWPSGRFAQTADLLISKFDAEIILVGSNEDMSISEDIKSQMEGAVTDAIGTGSILETTEIINKSDAMITNDSGLMHIAVSQKIPVLAIFGSTTEELGFFPYSEHYKVLEVADLKCRPCSHIGRNKCPKKHFKCMKDISPDKALRAMIELLEL